jgi:hypothetical protein
MTLSQRTSQLTTRTSASRQGHQDEPDRSLPSRDDPRSSFRPVHRRTFQGQPRKISAACTIPQTVSCNYTICFGLSTNSGINTVLYLPSSLQLQWPMFLFGNNFFSSWPLHTPIQCLFPIGSSIESGEKAASQR